MDRRQFLRLLSSGMVASAVDIDKILWIPGQKKIFLPHPKQIEFLNIHEIVRLELLALQPRLQGLFENSDLFYEFVKEANDEP